MKKLINALITSALILVFFVLQSTVAQRIAVGGIAPNLLVLLTVSLGLFLGDVHGMWSGFFIGLLWDLFFGELLGFYAIIYALIGYLSGKFGAVLYIDEVKFPALFAGAMDFLFGMYGYVFLFLFRNRLYIGYFLVHFVIPEAIYTVVISFAVYPLLSLLYRKGMKETPVSARGPSFIPSKKKKGGGLPFPRIK